jgi:hypothetical protein
MPISRGGLGAVAVAEPAANSPRSRVRAQHEGYVFGVLRRRFYGLSTRAERAIAAADLTLLY